MFYVKGWPIKWREDYKVVQYIKWKRSRYIQEEPGMVEGVYCKLLLETHDLGYSATHGPPF